MNPPTALDWAYFDSENNVLDNAIASLAELIVESKDPLSDIRSQVQSTGNMELFDHFELFEFNYEFLPREEVRNAVRALKAARALVKKVEQKHGQLERRRAELDEDWKRLLCLRNARTLRLMFSCFPRCLLWPEAEHGARLDFHDLTNLSLLGSRTHSSVFTDICNAFARKRTTTFLIVARF